MSKGKMLFVRITAGILAVVMIASVFSAVLLR